MTRPEPAGRDRRSVRRSSTALIGRMLLAAFVVGIAVLASALLTAPPVDDARARVAALARERGIAYSPDLPPPRFVAALVATEDQRFFSPLDPGVDPLAVARVVLGRAVGLPDQGGSTIEQQLAKMLYSPRQHGLLVELERVATAMKLNATYGKGTILAMYATVAYYGHGYYGLETASCGYFGRPPSELSWPQAAMLAGIVNAPSHDDPVVHPIAARARENHVFNRLVAVGTLSRSEADSLVSEPLNLGRPAAGGCQT